MTTETPIFDQVMQEQGHEMMPLPPTVPHDLFMAQHKAQWAKDKRKTVQVNGRPKAKSKKGKGS